MLKAEHRKLVEKWLIEDSRYLFERYPDLESFGWSQHTTVNWTYRQITIEESIEKPNVSGALGDTYIDPDGRQEDISRFLKGFSGSLLLAAFGHDVDVAVYKDQTIEITDDSNRLVVFEL